MPYRSLIQICVLLLSAVLAGNGELRAGTILKWQETTRMEGRLAHKAVVAYSSELGLRVQMLEVGSSVASSVILWVASTGTLHVKEGDLGWMEVTREQIESLRKKGSPAPRGPAPPAALLRATGARHTVHAFNCNGYTLSQKGLPSRGLCLTHPSDIGVDPTTRLNFKEMSRMLMAFMEAAENAGAKTAKSEEGIRFNTYDLAEGFPVRVWETRRGETWLDSELVSVTDGETPASLFQPPPKPEDKR